MTGKSLRKQLRQTSEGQGRHISIAGVHVFQTLKGMRTTVSLHDRHPDSNMHIYWIHLVGMRTNTSAVLFSEFNR